MIMGEVEPKVLSSRRKCKAGLRRSGSPNIDPEKSIWENFADGQDMVMMGGRW
jgi:hypothetical protein